MFFCKFSENILWKNILVYMPNSHITLDIYTHKIRNIFNKTINLTKILLNPSSTTVLYKLRLFDGESCTSSNLCNLGLLQCSGISCSYIHSLTFVRLKFLLEFCVFDGVCTGKPLVR